MKFSKLMMIGAVTASLTTACTCGNGSCTKTDSKPSVAKVEVIPRPKSVSVVDQTGVTIKEIVISASKELNHEAEYFKSELATRNNATAEIAANGNIKLALKKDDKFGTEGYSLTAKDGQVVVEAATAKGVFYGIQSLLQIIPIDASNGFVIPNMQIEDNPRFTWRASHLDVCRHFFPVSFVKRYIDFLAMHKFNKLHWHLTEDQGWRVEIDQYPKLTEVGAWRKINDIMDYSSRVNQETAEEIKARLIAQGSYKEINGEPYYGGFYTKEQLKEVVEYAKSRHVEIIPEIEMPGHTQAVMAAYPHMACEGAPESFEVWTRFGVSRNVFCAGKEETFTFLENVLNEVFEIFPSKMVHIGGDECPKANWKECSDCQKRIKDNNLHNEHELQSYFIKRMQKYINGKGRRIVGWSEILEGGLAEGATVMAWLGTGAGIQAAKQGNDAIMTPFWDTYYNMKEDPTGQGPGHSSSYLPIKQVYGFDPSPAKTEPAIAKHIIGYQPCIWTEYIPTTIDVEYLTFPRLLASSEVAWTERENMDFDHFIKRVNAYYPKMDKLNIRYFVNPPTLPGKRVVLTNEKPVEITTEFPNGKIYYTTDGSEPTQNSTLYTKPLVITEKTTLKAKTFAPNGLFSSTNQTIFELTGLNQVDKAGINNGLAYTLYKINKAEPSLKDAKEVRKGNCGGFVIPTGVKGDLFAVKYDGILEIKEAGNYTFNVRADDYIRLFIGGALVADNVGGTIDLDKGFYTVSAEFYEYWGAEKFSITMSKNGERKQTPVTADMLSFNGKVREIAYSTTMNTQGENALSFAFDGNDKTFFWSNGGPKENDSILVQLPTDKTVTEISVVTGAPGKKADRLYNGVIETSGDGLSFQTAATFKDGKAAAKFSTPQNFKFVRVRATKGQGNWLTVSEITIK